MKKLLALLLAATLTLGMVTTAFAEDPAVTEPNSDGVYKSDVTVSSETKTPTIKITVPSTAKVVVNPYGLPYTVDEKEYKDQIVSVVQVIKNESDVAINVNATVSGAPAEGGNAVLSTAALKGTETTNSVFMYLCVLPCTDGSAAGANFTAEKFSAASKNMILVGKTEVTKKAMVTLAAGNESATFCAFKFLGQVATAPTKAWTAADKVDVKLVFSFEPVLTTPAPAGE